MTTAWAVITAALAAFLSGAVGPVVERPARPKPNIDTGGEFPSGVAEPESG